MSKQKIWTQEEKDFFKNNREKMTVVEIAKYLNRTVPSIIKYIERSKIHKKSIFFSEEEKEFINNNYKNLSANEISKKLDRTKKSIQGYLETNGLKRLYHPTCKEFKLSDLTLEDLGRFFKKINFHDWTWIGDKTSGGYGSFILNLSTRKRVAAHRVMYAIIHGITPEGMVVRHKNHNPSSVDPLELEIGTQVDNSNDSFIDGTLAMGEKIGTSKLTEKDVLDILEKYKNGISGIKLAKEYNINHQSIYKILNKQRWKYLHD